MVPENVNTVRSPLTAQEDQRAAGAGDFT